MLTDYKMMKLKKQLINSINSIQKHEKKQIQVQFRNGAKKSKFSLFEKNCSFSGTNHDLCLKK
jgi:hypothetical protein